MKGPEMLKFFENNWPTNKGAWFPGEKVLYRGKALFSEFNNKSWMTLLIYGISGRMPSDKQVRMVEAMWSLSTSFPDPRIWNNRVAALAGTARTTSALGVAASNAVSEASIYGGRPILRSSDFLIKTLIKEHSGESVDDIVALYLDKHRALPGYGRPLIGNDERIEPVVRVASELGLDKGKHLDLLWRIEKILKKKRLRMTANIAAVYGALMADMGYSSLEAYRIAILSFSAGMFPCLIDAKEKREGAFFPLRISKVDYMGIEKRRWVNYEQ